MRRFFSRVLSSRIQVGVRAGIVAAAATAGAIIGFGARHDDWSGPFSSLGRQVLQGLSVSNPPSSLPTFTGIAAHLAWMVVWGIAFASLAHRRTSALAVMLALLVGILATLAARTILPAAMGAMRFAAMPGIQAALFVALMVAGLVTGRALSHAD